MDRCDCSQEESSREISERKNEKQRQVPHPFVAPAGSRGLRVQIRLRSHSVENVGWYLLCSAGRTAPPSPFSSRGWRIVTFLAGFQPKDVAWARSSRSSITTVFHTGGAS